MKIENLEEVALSSWLNEQEMLEFLAISLYKAKRINGVQGKLLSSSEIEFHGLLERYNKTVNYGVDEYLEDSDNLKNFD